MTIKQRLKEDMISAMKAKDRARLSAVRMAQNAIKNKEIELRRELSGQEEEAVVASEVKKRREAVEQYKKGGRDDLAEKEAAEAEILTGYLPEQLSEKEIRRIVTEAIGKTGAASMKDMGRVMKEVMPRVKGRADGAVVNGIVKEFFDS
ncbi:MAG: GatB/YqeY domain-containing protein [Candidatus Nitrospinota bacterium M3_3B_026]